MNRAFKIKFHNGEPDEKPIVTLSYTVNNGKRFKALSKKGKKNLLSNIEYFENRLSDFKQELTSPVVTISKPTNTIHHE